MACYDFLVLLLLLLFFETCWDQPELYLSITKSHKLKILKTCKTEGLDMIFDTQSCSPHSWGQTKLLHWISVWKDQKPDLSGDPKEAIHMYQNYRLYSLLSRVSLVSRNTVGGKKSRQSRVTLLNKLEAISSTFASCRKAVGFCQGTDVLPAIHQP